MTTLRAMGIGEPEEFRARIYDIEEDDGREAWLRALTTTGALDCPAYDPWVKALQERGWLPAEPEYEPAPGGGRHARWRMTERGRRELAERSKSDG